MNKLALATVMTLVSQAAGCIIQNSDPGGGVGVDTATISARWSLRNMSDGATTPCPSGFDTVQLFAQAIDKSGDAIGDPAIDLFDCNARKGTSTDLFPDVYQVWIEVRSHDLSRLYAQSLSQILDTTVTDQSFSTEVLNDGGYFQLSWDLIGKTTSRPLSCSQAVGANVIRTVSTSIADSTRAYDDTFPCAEHGAVSGGLLQGSYSIAIDAIAGDRSVGKATTLTTKVIAGQNQVTDLGTITIPIDGL
jgi:hypothetical protein